MSEQAETWRARADEAPPEQFWTDFGKMVLASVRGDDTEHYWTTMVQWSNKLMEKYGNNEIANYVVVNYYMGQCEVAATRRKA